MSLTLTEDAVEFPWEGMNEAGLSVGILTLATSVPPPATDPRPAVQMVQWIQYILDTSGTVEEAVRNAQAARVGPATTLHYFVCDATSDCAVFEYINGALVVHRSGVDLPEAALANDAYDASVAYLQNLMKTESTQTILAGSSALSLDRFSRASLWSQGYRAGGRDAIGYAFEGLRSVADPRTFWSEVFDLRERALFLSTRAAPQVKSIRLTDFDPNGISMPKAVIMGTTLWNE